nr:phospholipase-like protein [Tanacetum cinerariifolium]
YMILEIIEGDVFDRLHDEDVVSLCCLGILMIVLLGVEAKRRIPDWLLRLANDKGNLPAARLTPDETEARSNWWISSREYFDGGRQVEVEGDGNENVPLYHDITDKFQIQFGREEFFLVIGLRFGVENLADYNDRELPIPFRRRVFLPCYDGEHIIGYTTLEIIEDEVFDRLHNEDAVSLCCLGILQLVLLGVKAKRRIPDWMLRLENDRVGWDNYPWGSFVWPTLYSQIKPATEIDKKAYSIFGYTWAFKGNLPAARLTPDESEARSNWWILVGHTLMALLLQYWYANKLANPNAVTTWSIKLEKPDAGAVGHSLVATRFPLREQRPSFYKWTPYTEQPPTTILPKKRGNKNKNNVMKASLSPLNLGNAFDDENEGGGDLIFLDGEFTGNYLVYENVDPQKVKREHYVTLQKFLNDPKQIYLDCCMKGYLVPVTFWQQLVPYLCMLDIDSHTPMGWLSRGLVHERVDGALN